VRGLDEDRDKISEREATCRGSFASSLILEPDISDLMDLCVLPMLMRDVDMELVSCRVVFFSSLVFCPSLVNDMFLSMICTNVGVLDDKKNEEKPAVS